MNENIVLIFFFISNNLVDKLLSKEIIRTYDNLGKIICIDFPTGDIVESEHVESRISFDKQRDKLIVYRNTKVFRYLSLVKFLVFRHKKFKNKIENLNISKDHVVIFSSGNMVMDINPVWPKLISTYIKIFSSNKIFFTYVGVGPLDLLINKIYLRNVLNKVEKFTVRDRNSLIELNKIGVENVVSCLDPILKSNITIKENSGYSKIGIAILGQICFKSKKEYTNYIKSITNIIKRLIQEDREVVLFSTDSSDYDEIYKLVELNNIPDKLIKVVKSQKDIENLYKTLSFLVGGRMHSMILAQQKVIPYLGFNWQNKISELFINVENQNIFKLTNELNNEKIHSIIQSSINNEVTQKHMIYINQKNNQKVVQGSLI
ncbi:polysaccharide pyruvyl transferase family protein, partial [Mammaliicoccus sciuri]|uniref:polysaccharide pyruvyl transferase family protein n=1 Tax=Mammaliicoccus sciuri TaxID=1296 RepID=UPI00115E926F